MRLWHIVLAVFLLALILAIARDPVGRVALIVFFTSLSVVVLGVSSIMLLFRTIAAFGAAQSFFAHIEAVVATAGVLFVGGSSVLVALWFGARIVQLVTSG